jgi:ABC-type phosphate transport system auxiliary subunit
VFNNFVPNYKSLATIMQIFSDKISPKNQVILENEIIEKMVVKLESDENGGQIDGIVYRTFAKKFNEKYENDLLKEQKELLTYYISSFADNALELKMFLNNEIPRLKEQLEKAKKLDEIKEDAEMFNKTQSVIERLNSFAKEDVNENVLLTIMKTQELVKEIYLNADNN